jgi:hypothetical protein
MTVLLLLIGAGAIAFVFWLFERPGTIPGAGILLATALTVFFMSCTGALLLHLRRRDKIKTRAKIMRTAPSTVPSPPDAEGTVYEMTPGSHYQVMHSFTDYYGNSFQPGERLRFKERHFLPYEGGHTIFFHERSLYLQEDKDREILENFSAYIARVQQ